MSFWGCYTLHHFFINTKFGALPLQRHVNLCSFSYWQHDLFAKIDHRCILFNRLLHRSVASDLMLLSMKCCTQLIFFDSVWRSVSLAFSWTFFLWRSGFFLNFFEQFFIISQHSFLTDPEEQNNYWVRTRAGLAAYCCCQVPVFVSFHIPSTYYLFFFILLFFPVFFTGTCFFLFFFTTTIDFYLDTTITKHHHHQYQWSKDHQRKKGSQQRRKAPITTPNVTNALCSFRADWGGNYQKYRQFQCLLFFLYNTIKTHFSPWRVQSLFLLYAWQSQMRIEQPFLLKCNRFWPAFTISTGFHKFDHISQEHLFTISQAGITGNAEKTQMTG